MLLPGAALPLTRVSSSSTSLRISSWGKALEAAFAQRRADSAADDFLPLCLAQA